MSYEDVIPEEYMFRLMALAEEETKSSWEIGDITNLILKTAGKRLEVYQAIGAMIGKKSRTIREYSRVSAFYPPDIRQRYEVLGYDYFRVAARSENWRQMLDWALVQMDNLDGRPGSVDAMVREFVVKPEKRTDEEELHTILLRLQSLEKFSSFPDDLKEKIEDLIREIESRVIQ